MELLCPASLPIHNAELDEHSALIFAKLHIRELLATIHLRKDGLNLSRGVILGVELLNAVVAQFTALFFKEFMKGTSFGLPTQKEIELAKIMCDAYPGMDMVSFGPTLMSPHSPTERVEIPTVEKFYSLVKALVVNGVL